MWLSKIIDDKSLGGHNKTCEMLPRSVMNFGKGGSLVNQLLASMKPDGRMEIGITSESPIYAEMILAIGGQFQQRGETRLSLIQTMVSKQLHDGDREDSKYQDRICFVRSC